MTWNYRIILHDEDLEQWYGLHEVYYKDGKVSWSMSPTSFVAELEEGSAGVVKGLERALSDARRLPVLSVNAMVADDYYLEAPPRSSILDNTLACVMMAFMTGFGISAVLRLMFQHIS